MMKRNFSRDFRDFNNDTAITEIATNNFKPLKFKPFKKDWLIRDAPDVLYEIGTAGYKLLPNEISFYGYHNRGKAMAKAGALKYISFLIDSKATGEDSLLKYRREYYEDLRVNLLYAKIEAVKN